MPFPFGPICGQTFPSFLLLHAYVERSFLAWSTSFGPALAPRNVLGIIGLYPGMEECFLYPMALVQGFEAISIGEKQRGCFLKMHYSSLFHRHFATRSRSKDRQTNIPDGIMMSNAFFKSNRAVSLR